MTDSVARGRAGRGCSNCHKRRIKCDFRRPGCTQCARVQKACPGYPDPNAIIIRDQSKEVIQKSRAQAQLKSGSKSPFQICMIDEQASAETPLDSDSSSISSQPEGVKFFFVTYTVDHILSSLGTEDFSSSPLWQQAGSNDALYAAIDAVGLAGLSNVRNDKSIMTAARSAYSLALRHTMDAVKKVDAVQMDSTLKAVMILSMFEIVTSSEFASAYWADHMGGAGALLQLRDMKQIVDDRSARMLLQIYFAVAICCVHKNTQLPGDVEELAIAYKDAGRVIDLPTIDLAAITREFIQLHHCVRNRILTDSNEIVSKALSIEAQLQSWTAMFTREWKFSTVQAKEPHVRMFRGQYHIYNHHWIATVWNHFRWIRILVHGLILDHLTKVSTELVMNGLSQQRESLATIQEMAVDIFTSSPIHFLPHIVQQSTSQSVPRISGVFVLLWPVTVAALASGVSKEAVDWATALLEDIGRSMGVNQALAISQALRVESRSTIARVLFGYDTTRHE